MDIFWSDANSRAFSQDSNRDVVWQLIGVSVWLVAPLVYKLAPSVQGMLLRAAGRILERDQWWKPNVERKIDISKLVNSIQSHISVSWTLLCLL